MRNKTYTLILTFLLVGFLSNSSIAQVRIYPSLALGSEIETVGITFGSEYFVSSKVSFSPDFIFFFTNKSSRTIGGDIIETNTKLWELN